GGGYRHGGSLVRVRYGSSLALAAPCGDRLEPAVSTLTAVIRGCGPDPRVARGAGRRRGAWLLLGGRAAPGGWAGPAADVFGSALDGLGTRDRGPARQGYRSRRHALGGTRGGGDHLRHWPAGLPGERHGTGCRRPGAAITGRGPRSTRAHADRRCVRPGARDDAASAGTQVAVAGDRRRAAPGGRARRQNRPGPRPARA